MTQTSPVSIASSDGVTIRLHELGGEGPTLLVAHATGFCAGAYLPFARRLADRFRVVGMDFRAHGASTRPAEGNLAWSAMIDDVLAVVDHLGGGPLAAFGHSMGGACLLGAELRRPGILERAFVFEPIVIPAAINVATSPGDNFLAESARRRRSTFPSREEALARYASRRPLDRFRADVLHAYVTHGFADADDGSIVLRCRPEDESATFDAPAKPSVEDMAAVDVPVVVAVGDQDTGPGPAMWCPPLAETLPAGRLRRYAHLGHFGPFQDPDTIADDAADFLLAP